MILNLSKSEIRARASKASISLTGTNAALEIAPAKTGMIPVIVGGFLTFSGIWTIAFEDGDATELTGAREFDDNGIYEIPIGDDFIRGTSGSALNLNATRTGGNCEGHFLYIYIPA